MWCVFFFSFFLYWEDWRQHPCVCKHPLRRHFCRSYQTAHAKSPWLLCLQLVSPSQIIKGRVASQWGGLALFSTTRCTFRIFIFFVSDDSHAWPTRRRHSLATALGFCMGCSLRKEENIPLFLSEKNLFSSSVYTHTQQLMYCARHLAQARLNSLAIYARTNVTQQVVVFWRNNQFPSLLFSAVANVPETAGARGRRFLLVPRWRNLFGWSILFKFYFLISLLFGSLPHIQDE